MGSKTKATMWKSIKTALHQEQVSKMWGYLYLSPLHASLLVLLIMKALMRGWAECTFSWFNLQYRQSRKRKSGKCANNHAWDLVRAIPQHSQAAMSLNNPYEEQESMQKIDMAIMEVMNAATDLTVEALSPQPISRRPVFPSRPSTLSRISDSSNSESQSGTSPMTSNEDASSTFL